MRAEIVRNRVIVGVVLSGLALTACSSSPAKSGGSDPANGSNSAATASAQQSSASAPATPAVSPAPSATTAAVASPAATSPSATSSVTAAAASPVALAGVLPAGEGDARDRVPWAQVGPGWFLVLDDSSAPPAEDGVTPRPQAGVHTLSLVSPTASRYVIASWPGEAAGSGLLSQAGLAAWSGDGHRALFLAAGPGLVEVDLTTGAWHAIPIENLNSVNVGYTTPAGTNVYAMQTVFAQDGTEAGENLVRLNRDGVVQVQLAHFDSGSPEWLAAADGDAVFLSGFGGLRKVSNAGGVVTSLPTFAKPDVNCVPVSWWTPQTIVAKCNIGAGDQLWLVPTAGGQARPLTPAPGAGPVGAGYRSALRIGATTYAQHLEGCGVVSIHTLAPNGVGTRVHIPASLSNDVMIGAAGTKIAVVSATECGWPSWFGFYDPATKTTQKIIPDVPGELGVDNALAFPGR